MKAVRLLVCRKRNCRFNLGGHCDTENAAASVARWHNLNSAWSPGRRRRKRSIESRDAGNKQNDRLSPDILPFNVLYRQLLKSNDKQTPGMSSEAPVAQFSRQSPTSQPAFGSNAVPRRCFRFVNGSEQQPADAGLTCIDDWDGTR
jgi:hypothetical protein